MSQAESEAQRLNQRGDHFAQQGLLNLAADYWQGALDVAGDEPQGLLKLARVYRLQGLSERALLCLEKVLEIEPFQPEAQEALLDLWPEVPEYSVEQHALHVLRWAQKQTPLPGLIRPSVTGACSSLRMAALAAGGDRGMALDPCLQVLQAAGLVPRLFLLEPCPTLAYQGAVELVPPGSAEAQLDWLRQQDLDLLLAVQPLSGRLLRLLALQVAPLQMAGFGLSLPLGLQTVALQVTATALIPEAVRPLFKGGIARLPVPLVWQPPPQLPWGPPLPPPCLRGNPFTLGSGAPSAWLNERVLALWGRLLQRLSPGRLLLWHPCWQEVDRRVFVRDYLLKLGARPEQICFQPGASLSAILPTLDLLLPTFPQASPGEACAALAQGIPILSLGQQMDLRVQALLQQAGMHELIAPLPKDYLNYALAMQSRAAELSNYRQQVQTRFRDSGVMQTAPFIQALQMLFAQAAHRLQRG